MLFPRINEDTMVNQEGNKKRIWIFKQFLDYKPIRDGLNRRDRLLSICRCEAKELFHKMAADNRVREI